MRLRRLPGNLRGFLYGASLWRAEDHILSVVSHRLREEYRRFYFRDIQAIVVTRCPRYVFSTRSAALTALLLVGCMVPATRVASALLLFCCAVAWGIVSWRFSCVCRLHTAVSAESAGSVYRIWTARRLLAELEPLINAAQADLPPVSATGEEARPVVSADAAQAPPEPAAARPRFKRRTAAPLLLLSLVLADAVATTVDMLTPGLRLDSLMTALLAAQVAAAVWLIVQHRTAGLARNVLLWGISFLVYVGVMMYAHNMVMMFDKARATRPGSVFNRRLRADDLFRQVYVGGCILFAAAGAFVMFRPSTGDER